ncbi:hypothetical protein B0E52_13145 [Rhodanobacter sp. C06]|nr:hypothetical protein B0E52_13145 [Rhodanobacter sp. C06]
MQARGYELIRASKTSGTSWTFWWNDARHACVSVSTVDGRYASLQKVPAANCSTSPSGNSGDDMGSAPEALTLVCYGEGVHSTYEPRHSSGYNPDTKKTESSVKMESAQEHFRTTVTLEVGPQGGRIQLEGKMVPPMHDKAVDGWWPLSDVHFDDDAITGKYHMNFVSKPTIQVDRHTGVLTIKGTQNFSGKCEKSTGGRKF